MSSRHQFHILQYGNNIVVVIFVQAKKDLLRNRYFNAVSSPPGDNQMFQVINGELWYHVRSLIVNTGS